MNHVQLHFARQQLHSQISHLDLIITRLMTWLNSESLISGSMAIKGRTSFGKNFHEVISFDHNLPLPIEHIKLFLHQYGQDLIGKRNVLLVELEELEKNPQFVDPNNVI